jgi:hypothetical protein
VSRALTEGAGIVPVTHWKEFATVRAGLARLAGLRSWAPFDRRTRMCSVRESDAAALSVMAMRYGGARGPGKGFHECPELAFEAAAIGFLSELGAAVRRGLELSEGPLAPRAV